MAKVEAGITSSVCCFDQKIKTEIWYIYFILRFFLIKHLFCSIGSKTISVNFQPAGNNNWLYLVVLRISLMCTRFCETILFLVLLDSWTG